MNKTIIAILIIFFAVSTDFVNASGREDLITLKSAYSVKETSANLVKLLTDKGFTIFTTIDHQAGAHKVGLELNETQVVIFGNPKIGSKLMQCAPTIAIDLPQKALIWKDEDGTVKLAVNKPSYLKRRHKVKGCDAIFPKITSALTAISIRATQK